jgi:hypothetical protein
MAKDDDTLSIIFDAQVTANEKDRMYWLWLGSAYGILRNRSLDVFSYQSDLERAYGAAKQIIMELWTVRAFLAKLKISTEGFDKLVPSLKSFRDAIAHIDERTDGTMLISGKSAATQRSKASMAGGILATEDGIHWSGFKFCYGIIGSSDGLHTPFGLVRDWIITNTDQGPVELQLTPKLFDRLDELIKSIAAGRIGEARSL